MGILFLSLLVIGAVIGVTLKLLSNTSSTATNQTLIRSTGTTQTTPPLAVTTPTLTQPFTPIASPPPETTPVTTTTLPTSIPEPSPSLPPTPLTILSITDGDVFVMRAGTSSWTAAKVGMTLQPGDSIKSGNNSHAEVTFFEGSTVELDGSTQISLSDINIADSGSTKINLKQEFGTTISRVTKLTDQESKYEIETPAAIAAVRGSVMSVTVLEDGTTVVTNVEGDIRVIAQGVEVIIPVGMKSTVVPGQPPGAPESIVPPIVLPGGGGGIIPPVYEASINTGVKADRTEAHIGETITYIYTIFNSGDLQMSDISISDSVTGTPVFSSGDVNNNSHLDSGETWIYTATHIAGIDDPSPLVNTVTFQATVSNSTTLIAEDQTSVLIVIGITTNVLNVGEIGAEYLETLTAAGGTTPYVWILGTGNLPGGLGLDSETGNITGTPTTAGVSNFTIQVTDSLGETAAKDMSITINETLTINTESLPDGEVGVEYSQNLVAANGIPSYTWSIIRGVLPDGLTLDSANGNISGMPTSAVVSNIIIRVTDQLGVTVTKELTIIVQSQ